MTFPELSETEAFRRARAKLDSGQLMALAGWWRLLSAVETAGDLRPYVGERNGEAARYELEVGLVVIAEIALREDGSLERVHHISLEIH